MNRYLYVILFALCSTTLMFSQNYDNSSFRNKWTAGGTLGAFGSIENALVGIEYGLDGNYYILDRLGLSMSMHNMQSLFPNTPNVEYSMDAGDRPLVDNIKSDNVRIENYSLMTLSLNVFGDVLKSKKNNRLRLSIGGTYFRGAYDAVTSRQGNKILITNTNFINRVGLNLFVGYVVNLSERCYIETGVATYMGAQYAPWIDNGSVVKLDALSAKVSCGYKF